MLPIAATQPPGEATRLDSFRGALAGELLVRLALADADSALAEALDRWELSLFQNEPFRSEQLRAALARSSARPGRSRAAVLLETEPTAREALHGALERLCDGDEAESAAREACGARSSRSLRDGDRGSRSARASTARSSGSSAPGRLRAAS